LIIALLGSFSNLWGQEVFPFIDNLEYLRSFQNGVERQVDYLRPVHVKYSEEIIAYIDNKKDFFIYDGESKQKMTGLANDFKIGIEIAAWNTGPIVSVWDRGEKQVLTQFGGRYEVRTPVRLFQSGIAEKNKFSRNLAVGMKLVIAWWSSKIEETMLFAFTTMILFTIYITV